MANEIENKSDVIVEPVVVVTLESLEAAHKLAVKKLNDAVENPDTSDAEMDKLTAEAGKARQAVKKFKADEIAQQAEKDKAEKLAAHLSIIPTFIQAVIQANAINYIKAEKRTDEQRAESDKWNAVVKELTTKLEAELTISLTKQMPPKQINVSAGMTGKQLEKVLGTSNGEKAEGKEAFYLRLINEQGMTKESIMEQYPESKNAEGGPNGTLRTAWGKRANKS